MCKDMLGDFRHTHATGSDSKPDTTNSIPKKKDFSAPARVFASWHIVHHMQRRGAVTRRVQSELVK
jgi:hypothetical protein